MAHPFGDLAFGDQRETGVGEGVEAQVGVPEPPREAGRLTDERSPRLRVDGVQGAG
jgi:hypothetical protein